MVSSRSAFVSAAAPSAGSVSVCRSPEGPQSPWRLSSPRCDGHTRVQTLWLSPPCLPLRETAFPRTAALLPKAGTHCAVLLPPDGFTSFREISGPLRRLSGPTFIPRQRLDPQSRVPGRTRRGDCP